jgi:hypothetical protein
MRQFVFAIAAVIAIALSAPAAKAQWTTWQSPPVVVAPAPVVVHRAPMVVYTPTTMVYTRHRPILGGTVVRTRPGVQRTVIW